MQHLMILAAAAYGEEAANITSVPGMTSGERVVFIGMSVVLGILCLMEVWHLVVLTKLSVRLKSVEDNTTKIVAHEETRQCQTHTASMAALKERIVELRIADKEIEQSVGELSNRVAVLEGKAK